jgi:adhesin/invasin
VRPQATRIRAAQPRFRRPPHRRIATWAAACLAALAASLGVAGRAQAAGTGVSIAYLTAPSTVIADGVSQTTATVEVTDSGDAGVTGDTVTFSSPDDPDIGFSNPATDNGDGTYTITVTSSTHAGTPTIRATDNTAGNDLTADTTLTQTPGAASHITLQLSRPSIIADGSDTSTATATVTDAHGNPVSGESVSFSSTDAGDQFSASPVTTDASGNASTTITSSTTVGTPTITAADGTLSDQQPLTQTTGPPSAVFLLLSPSSILADGVSSTTATATVIDAQGHGIPGETVSFTSTDAGETITATTDHGDGTYTATIRSSTTPHTVTITARDTTAHLSQTAPLVQDASASTTSLVTSPSAAVTNQTVTLFASVTPTSAGTLSGTVSFKNRGFPISAACSNLPLSHPTCQATFSAASSPEQLTAVFTPDLHSTVAGSTSAASLLPVSRDGTSTTVAIPRPTITPGSTTTYTATITPNHGGPARATGTVAFFDGRAPIAACAHQPLNGALTATCTVSYGSAGTHGISARYGGDGNFAGSGSAVSTETVNAPPITRMIHATMQWTFAFTRTYTKIVALVINGAPTGAKLVITCHGRGCPFGRQATTITKPRRCKRHCSGRRPGTIDLAARFHQRHLRVGAQITVQITRPGWIGKYYRFTIRAHRGPRIQISCLAPGSSRPGVGC